jgi:enterochelin esterase-like enzyme
MPALGAWLWPLGLGLAVGAALVVESSSAWQALNAGLIGLDFDPERAAMLQAWGAGALVAGLGAMLSGRPWWSVVAATVFVGITYTWPLGERLQHDVPSLFGTRELVSGSAIRANQAVVLAVAFLAAVPPAATGQLLRNGMIRLGTVLLAFRRDRLAEPSSIRGTGILVVLATIGTSLVLVPGADPVLRFGPTHGVYRPASAPPRTLVDPSQTALPPEVVPTSGQLLTRTYHSDAMAQDRAFLVYLPPTYNLRAARQHRYPVLYLLHGDPGELHQWVVVGAPALFDAGSARGILPETILVMPDGNGRAGVFTDWTDSVDGRNRLETALLELVSVVDREYRTLADRRYRLIAGLSSGAYGAANIGARNPDQFGTAMSFSGYFVGTSPALGGDPAAIRANSPYYLVQDRPAARTVDYILVVGNQDPQFQRRTQAFADLLTGLGVPHQLNVVAGGHGGNVWAQGLALGMAQVAAALTHPSRVISEDHDRRRL